MEIHATLQQQIKEHGIAVALAYIESVIHMFSQMFKQSSCSSVSARDHHGEPTWSCFLVAECCAHSRTRFSLQVHVDQYSDCSSSHREKENLACGKFGVESFAVSVVLIHGIFNDMYRGPRWPSAHGNPISCKTAITTTSCTHAKSAVDSLHSAVT